METQASLIESLLQRAEDYGKTTYELSKLKLLETTTIVVPSLAARIIVIIMISLFALILNIGIALLLGELLGKSYYGFFIVAGFYLIVAIVFHFFLHNWIKKPVSELIIKQALQ
jgi:membrane-bound ClpP family serine protease